MSRMHGIRGIQTDGSSPSQHGWAGMVLSNSYRRKISHQWRTVRVDVWVVCCGFCCAETQKENAS